MSKRKTWASYLDTPAPYSPGGDHQPVQRVEDLPIYLQAQAQPAPWEYAQQRSIGGAGLNYTSVRVYNGPYKSGNTRSTNVGPLGWLTALAVLGLLVALLLASGGVQ